MKYLPVNCNDCKQCCHNFILIDEDLSFTELNYYFYFSREMCDVFYESKAEGTYHIGETCKMYKDGLCSIQDDDLKPVTCRLYPLFIVSDKKDNNILMIDKNCKEYKNILTSFKDQNHFNTVLEMIKSYLKADKIIIYPQKALKNLGYKLKKIQALKVK